MGTAMALLASTSALTDVLTRTSSLELFGRVLSGDAPTTAIDENIKPEVKHPASNLSIITQNLGDAMGELRGAALCDLNLSFLPNLSPVMQSEDPPTAQPAATPPRFIRVPSGNSFAVMPCAMTPSEPPLPHIEQVASSVPFVGDDNHTMDCNTSLAEARPCEPAPGSTQPILDRCESRELMAMLSHGLLEDQAPMSLIEQPLQQCGLGREVLGPFGPYNPAPSWMAEPATLQAVPQPAREPDDFEGRQVVMVRGKYKGRTAFVERKVRKKYRLQVDGVQWGLEFYPNMFTLPSGPVRGSLH